MKKAFEKFGRSLSCPETRKGVYIPKNLRVKHYYQVTNNLPMIDDVLETS
jgi:hypothetical protein